MRSYKYKGLTGKVREPHESYKGHDWYHELCNYGNCKHDQEGNGFCEMHNKARDKNGDIE